MRMKLSVQFQGEEGIDAGGVSREWYQVTTRACILVLTPRWASTMCLVDQCKLLAVWSTSLSILL